MTKHLYFALGLGAALVALTIYGENYARADFDMKVANDRGTYARTRVISPSSFTGTAVWPGNDDGKLMDSVCVLNSANIVWLGTTTATSLNAVLHSNIVTGIPITSTQSFSLKGAFSGGNIAATCDQDKTVCQIRCLDQLNR